ncbi:MAG TPA: C4-dicarboxylate ABC transporter substrate-binding protein [Desulfobacteraceae bacterium]|nr:C4-dicarboxylate ABC transporter substrate-binding protein [Desulfobacteraceae bacterium]
MKKKFTFLFILTAVLVAVPLAAGAAGSIKWRMQVLWDPGTQPYKIEEEFVKRVKELTGDRLEIKVFPPGSLVPTNEMLDAVQGGMFELMKTYEGYYIGKMPQLAFTSSLPLGFTDSWQFETWFWQLGGVDMLRDDYAKQGCYYIAPTIYGEEPLHSKIPIRSLEDIKGKKGRFVGVAGPVMSKLGAAVTPLPTAEVYPALEKGVIDFADRGGLAANFDAGLHEVAKYIILPGFHQPTTATCYVANLDAWNELPDDIKAIVVAAAREASAEMFQQSLVQDMISLEKFKEKGCEVIYLPADEVKKIRLAAREVWEEYAAKNESARKIYDSQISWMKKLGLL